MYVQSQSDQLMAAQMLWKPSWIPNLMISILNLMVWIGFSCKISWSSMQIQWIQLLSHTKSHDAQCNSNGLRGFPIPKSNVFHCKSNGLRWFLMPKSPHSQCFCKISHAESHEFHEESNGLNSFPSPSLMKSNDFKGFHFLMIMADPLLGGSAKKSAFSNSAYLVELQGGGGGGGGLLIRGWH